MQGSLEQLSTVAWIQEESLSFERKGSQNSGKESPHPLLYQDLPLGIPSRPPHAEQMKPPLLLDPDPRHPAAHAVSTIWNTLFLPSCQPRVYAASRH